MLKNNNNIRFYSSLLKILVFCNNIMCYKQSLYSCTNFEYIYIYMWKIIFNNQKKAIYNNKMNKGFMSLKYVIIYVTFINKKLSIF